MENNIDKLLELEEKLIKAREELLNDDLNKTAREEMIEYLEKQMGMMDSMTGMPGGTAASGGVNTAMGKKEHEDEEEDKKMIEEKLDEHNEKKHGEPKDEDSAMKSEMIKFDANGQWSFEKAEQSNIKYPSKKDLEYPDSPAIRAAEAKEKEMQVQMPERKVFKADEDEA